uniref:CSON005712 protein n=1 Tax=Culicoides sonorensis TaxID=179676 RepID=A0A336L843_CULSO
MHFKSIYTLLVLILINQKVSADEAQNQGLRTVTRIYDECQKAEFGFVSCMKKKAIAFIDRINRFDALNISDGLRITRNDDMPSVSASLSESDLEQMLPRSVSDRDSTLSNMLIERIAQFFSTRTVQISLPQITATELGRELEEGRGKMKKMMSMMMMTLMMKFAAMIPVAIAGLYVLAGKALIISKIALLLAGIIGLKKLLQSKQGSSGGWQSGSQSGWDKRSVDAHNLVYKGYLDQKLN